ncbi:hypothetical protein [Salinispora arenicola]|uniref:hypothetical protein n=1 Tax=Salinispora arenicola TaxID=168697 RepID=UPI0027DB5200|nr:hypothetical protein [Salinispora arenicola]
MNTSWPRAARSPYALSITTTPGDDWDKFLTDESNDAAENCVRNVIVNPSELTSRAYINAGYCDVYTSGSQYYKNCIASVLSPTFLRDQTLTVLTAIIEDITALLIPVAGALAIGCLLTVVCGTVALTLLTIGEVGFNFEQYISGDQNLAETLLDLGTLALEALAFAGAAKLIGTGFQAAKQLYTISRAAKQAEVEISRLTLAAARLKRLPSCLSDSNSFALAPLHTNTHFAAANNRTILVPALWMQRCCLGPKRPPLGPRK